MTRIALADRGPVRFAGIVHPLSSRAATRLERAFSAYRWADEGFPIERLQITYVSPSSSLVSSDHAAPSGWGHANPPIQPTKDDPA